MCVRSLYKKLAAIGNHFASCPAAHGDMLLPFAVASVSWGPGPTIAPLEAFEPRRGAGFRKLEST